MPELIPLYEESRRLKTNGEEVHFQREPSWKSRDRRSQRQASGLTTVQMRGEAYDNQSDEEHEWLKWSSDGTKDKDKGPHCREEELSHSSDHRATAFTDDHRLFNSRRRSNQCDLYDRGRKQ
ncbi:hypothetical protein H4Q26_000176 [Puccinia striiformis f. sp. tritici PST-130]|nr:hypothetical protein H4Q26_000176 [Puccinia striiformis f. sp. tritici PST-130]